MCTTTIIQININNNASNITLKITVLTHNFLQNYQQAINIVLITHEFFLTNFLLINIISSHTFKGAFDLTI